jgi:hypothetical protein
MARATGPGKTEKRTNPPSLMLFNFDVDGDTLKEEHKAFLRTEALPVLRSGGSVSVIGLTDRSGADAHNKTLSERRVAQTIAFLRQEVPTGVNLKQATGFGEEAAAREGEKDGTLDERFRSVLLFLSAAPVVTKNKTIEVTAKSLIALIGSKIGFIPGMTFISLPSGVPVPVPRQTLLETLAKARDVQFNENPLNSAKDRRYRLFSSCRFTVVWEDRKILAAVPSVLDTDVGTEGPLQPPPLITSPVTVSPKGDSFVKFTWTGKGRPHLAAEPAFQTVQSRASVFIWHIIEGQIDVSSDTPITTVTIRGSQFPSHRVFVDGKLIHPELRQGPFSNLWVSDSSDRTKVK